MSHSTQLTWAIKTSLVEYISALEDGTITVSGSAEQTPAGFVYSLDAERSNFDPTSLEGTMQFQGSVVFSGHWGMLNIDIRDPEIRIQGTQGILSVLVGGVLSPATLIDFAQLKLSGVGSAQDITTRLTAGGKSIMGEQYSVGQELSPLRIAVAQS